MKNLFLLLWVLIIGIALTGCDGKESNDRQEEENTGENVARLKFLASSGSVTKSATETPEQDDFVFFINDDLEWYNGRTGEMKFKSQLPPIDTVVMKSLKFYLGDEYLFSSVMTTWVNAGYQSEICNSLIFYYTAVENKYFLKDGYPDVGTISDREGIQEIRDENMEKIDRQWKRFIATLKEEGKYKE
jgi:GH24 family phage-related lysozyme (muramidase)